MMEPKNNPISVEITDPKPVQQNRCYTVDDLMTMLGMSRKSVYELLKRREFRWFQLGQGGHCRIVRESFEQWLSAKL